MANTERAILREFIVRKPDATEAGRIFIHQSQQPNRTILAEWHDKNGDVFVTTTIVPNRYKNDPNELRAFSKALAGVNKLSVQEVLPSQSL